MAIQKVDSYDEYQFSELGRELSKDKSIEDAINQKFDSESTSFSSLVDEADRARNADFEIHNDVFELRKIKLAKK